MIELGNSSIKGRIVNSRISEPRATAARAVASDNTSTAMSGTVASSSSLDGLVRQKLFGKFYNDPGIRFGDGSYYLPTLEEVRSILQESQLNRRKWLAERFDCDDFAYVLKGEMSIHAYESSEFRFALCVGIVWGNFDWINGYHAVNWFIDSSGEIRFIEPQTDEIFDLSHCQGQITLLLV